MKTFTDLTTTPSKFHYHYLLKPTNKKTLELIEQLDRAFTYLKNNKFSKKLLTNQQKCKQLYSAVIDYLQKQNGVEKTKEFIKLLPPLSEFGHVINDNYEEFVKRYPSLKFVSTQKETKYDRIAKEYFNTYGYLEDIENANNLELNDGERIVVIRSKWGNGDVLCGVINQSLTDHLARQLRAAYKKQAGIPYYEGRPILYDTWLELPIERQIATATADGKDTEEFVEED